MTSTIFCLVYLVVPVVLSWTVSQVKPLFSLRYLLPFLPPYYILIGQGLDALRLHAAGRLRSGWLWTIALAGLIAVGLIGIAGSATHEQEADWRGISTHVVANAQPNDVVLFVPGWNWKPFDYYARGRIALKTDPPLLIEPDNTAPLVTEATQGKSRLWLVQTEGHYADPGGLLRAYLDRTYRRLDSQPYRDNITVSLYQISP